MLAVLMCAISIGGIGCSPARSVAPKERRVDIASAVFSLGDSRPDLLARFGQPKETDRSDIFSRPMQGQETQLIFFYGSDASVSRLHPIERLWMARIRLDRPMRLGDIAVPEVARLCERKCKVLGFRDPLEIVLYQRNPTEDQIRVAARVADSWQGVQAPGKSRWVLSATMKSGSGASPSQSRLVEWSVLEIDTIEFGSADLQDDLRRSYHGRPSDLGEWSPAVSKIAKNP